MTEEEEAEDPQDGGELAAFSDRVVAFSIDYALFAVGFFLSLKLFFPKYPVLLNPHGRLWAVLWTALFFLYQAYHCLDGRASVGKRLLGIQVLTLEGEPLGLGTALLRSMGYMLSSILALGFVWILFNQTRQAWHDMIVGSVVVRTGERSGAGRVLVQVLAFLCIFAFIGSWTWGHVLAEYYYRTMTAANAYVGLKEIDQLQKVHHRIHGRYADNLIPLAIVSEDPEGFMRDMAAMFDVKSGVDIKLTGKGYTIKVVARDADHTVLTLKGP